MKKNMLMGLLLGCLLVALNGCTFMSKCSGDPVPGEPASSTSNGVSLNFHKDAAKYQEALQQQGSGAYSDPYTLQSAVREGDVLKITVRYGGGCARHHFELIWNGVMTRSLPGQATMFLRHKSNGDNCEALITETLDFNIREKMDMPGEQVRITILNASNKEQVTAN